MNEILRRLIKFQLKQKLTIRNSYQKNKVYQDFIGVKDRDVKIERERLFRGQSYQM